LNARTNQRRLRLGAIPRQASDDEFGLAQDRSRGALLGTALKVWNASEIYITENGCSATDVPAADGVNP
jgi:hypothetical protein